MGFEPMMEYNPHTRLAGERLQPARPSLQKFFQNFYIKLHSNFIGGGSRIRTHGGVNLNGFQDRRFRPLSHPSKSQLKFLTFHLYLVNALFRF